MSNQKCKVRLETVNVNNDDPVFYPFSIKTSKFDGNCDNINDPYVKICVPDVVKNLNVTMFSIKLRTNETRHIEWHEMKRVSVNVDQMQAFLMINHVRIMINAGVNANN